jgi:hypothetical protein
MTTTKKFSQTSPDKVNELFAKLFDTSENAIKTRERLFSDLKDELALLANLHEQYLFPVLRKNKETRDLVNEAINDNKQTEALLAELDGLPKNDAAFLKRLADLRKVFQQHIRDDKNELLPAVVKVLSEEEAQAVAEQVEEEIAQVEEARRSETEQRRIETRQEREQAQNVQRIAEGAGASIRTGVESTQHMASTMQEAMSTGFTAASELAQRSTDQAMRFVGLSGRDEAWPAAQASEGLRTLAQSGTALASRVQDMSQEWLEMSQHRLQKNLDGLNALVRCRSVLDFVAVQRSLARDNLELTIENSRRVAELSARMVDEATRRVQVQTKQDPR